MGNQVDGVDSTTQQDKQKQLMKVKKTPYISLLLAVSFFFVVAVHPLSASEDSHRTWLKPISDLPLLKGLQSNTWHQPDLIPNTYFVVLILIGPFSLATRNLKRLPESKGQTLLELFTAATKKNKKKSKKRKNKAKRKKEKVKKERRTDKAE